MEDTSSVVAGSAGQVPYYDADGDSFSTTSAMTILATGRVGIGNAAPTYTFDTTGTGHFTSYIDAANFIATSSSATSLFNGALSVIGSSLFRNASTTNLTATGATWLTGLSASSLLATDANKMLVATSSIGVNNLALTKGYFIVGNDAGVAQATSSISVTSTGTVGANAIIPNGPYTTNVAGFDLGASTSRWNALWASALNIGTSLFSIKNDANSNLGIFTASGGGGTQALTITPSGSIGIGTNSLPSARFKIESNVASASDGYDDQSKIASITSLTVSGSQLKLSPLAWACGDTLTFTYNGGSVTYGTVTGADGKCWMDRNLGATRAATSATDASAYGHYFQWGRPSDGHQVGNSAITATLSSSDVPGHSSFIAGPSAPYDWRSPQSPNAATLWAGASGGSNNPCPTSWHVPTQTEWGALVTAAGITNAATAYSSTLKLSRSGYRYRDGTSIYDQNNIGYYLSSTVSGTGASIVYITGSSVIPASSNMRSSGATVRCVKD